MQAITDLIAASRDMLTVWDGVAHPSLAYPPGAPATRIREALAALDSAPPINAEQPLRAFLVRTVESFRGRMEEERSCIEHDIASDYDAHSLADDAMGILFEAAELVGIVIEAPAEDEEP